MMRGYSSSRRRATYLMPPGCPVSERPVPQPPRPAPRLPNPGVCTNGMRPCNEPLVVNGQTVGYCSRLVWPPSKAAWWRRPPGTHKGRHAVEWGA